MYKKTDIKIIDDSLIDNKSKKVNIKIDESNNKLISEYNMINDETKIVVVGTITPPDIKFFYCAKKTRMFGYMDQGIALKYQGNDVNIDFKTLKNQILKYPNNNQYISDMADLCKKHNIAFIDVFKRVIRNDPNSHYDDDILFASLDYDVFKLLDNKNIYLVCNSKLASDMYCIIKDKLSNGGYLIPKYDYLKFHGYAKKQPWVDIFKKYL